ncbi:MAG: tyrosine-type recombinase/integrase, partial [Nitrospirae bacterium]|nr:tyrosine-type recombinase/integrase [Nitrospirota bacterium]
PQWVFLSPMGFRWEERNLKRCYTKCLEASGLRHVRFHDLRHSYASHLIDLGTHSKYIQEQLGHSSIQVTMDIYGHLFPNRNKGWVNRLDDGSFEGNSATPPQPGIEIPEGIPLSA